MFESTTVFQRLKTMKTLDGMSSKSVPILVFRNRQWETTTTADLVRCLDFCVSATSTNAGVCFRKAHSGFVLCVEMKPS